MTETWERVRMEGRTVLRIQVPRATRQQRPVHLGNNPFGGTYLRRHEGDYLVDDEAVRRMLAERVEDSRDERVLKGFELSDLDMNTVAAYRNRFAAVKPGHVWVELDVAAFLECIGAHGKNREEGYSGLRLAGLLMFGRAEKIRDALPHYMVDYQERPEPKAENRWIDRLVPDGSWSGNLYDFFRRVYQKLTADLKVPFQLQDGQRIDDTPVHEALREALTNTLIHADYSGRVSVSVLKRPDLFVFRNPGRMRIPPFLAIQGGTSDCRNRRLQTMFQLVGYGDHAGSGLPKIYKNWAGQHWRRPQLYEITEPEQTRMELPISSLVPEWAVEELTRRLDSRFTALPETNRLALIIAQVEGMVSHDRLKQITREHPADLTKELRALALEGLLISEGTGRGTIYRLPWQNSVIAAFKQIIPDKPIEPPELALKPPELGLKPPELSSKPPEFSPKPPEFSPKPPEFSPKPPEFSPKPPEFSPKPPELDHKPPELDHKLPELSSKPPELVSYLDWATIPAEEQAELLRLAAPVATQRKANAFVLRETILALCKGRFLGLRVLAYALKRDSDDLRKRTLTPMVQEGLLRAAYLNARAPRQAYTSPMSEVEHAT